MAARQPPLQERHAANLKSNYLSHYIPILFPHNYIQILISVASSPGRIFGTPREATSSPTYFLTRLHIKEHNSLYYIQDCSPDVSTAPTHSITPTLTSWEDNPNS